MGLVRICAGGHQQWCSLPRSVSAPEAKVILVNGPTMTFADYQKRLYLDPVREAQ
jgi:hypothetical protein